MAKAVAVHSVYSNTLRKQNIVTIKNPISFSLTGFFSLGYQDSNLENAGVRVQCLTVWR